MLRMMLVGGVLAMGLTACASPRPHGPPAPSPPNRAKVTPPPPPIEAIRPRY
ncbi:hypothetical protein J2X45_000145 [Caulobacter sp. BE264]|uniref:hypothetical protein n=1 Tax=Caulobacter sp. BE264 TaxID=2817724 RepID=UPI00286333C3|nr:hypothetical protein [Caulobacter sp. BE264]MDR7229082.1 hypothetical protein [Caulobacter sp. BE264]